MTDHGVTQSEFKYLKEHLTAKMIQILAEEQGYSLEDAINRVYTSDIYKKLSDRATGLYIQSPRYIMSYL
jgi:arsenate reductase-like glutaredoxin family protein